MKVSVYTVLDDLRAKYKPLACLALRSRFKCAFKNSVLAHIGNLSSPQIQKLFAGSDCDVYVFAVGYHRLDSLSGGGLSIPD